MKSCAQELKGILREYYPKLKEINAVDWNTKPGNMSWTRKEILGHLIDSTSNNHHRIVKVRFNNIPEIVYAQNDWVNFQDYNSADTENSIDLFYAYNMHLVHVISVYPDSQREYLCDIGKGDPVTIEFIVSDYLRHIKHHLNQIFNEL